MNDSIDSFEVITRFSIGIEIFILILIGYFIRSIVDHRGYADQQDQLTQSDNLASAVSLSAYLFAIIISLLDSLSTQSESLIAQLSEVAYKGVALIFFMELSMFVIDHLWLRGVSVKEQIHRKANVSIGIARGAGMISIAMMLRGVFEGSQPWSNMFLWASVGVICIFGVGAIFQWLTPYDDLAEMSQNNISAALPLAGAWLAVGITVESAISGESTRLFADLLSVFIYLILATVAIWLVRASLKSVFFRQVDLTAEITQDRNSGVALLEATLYICVAEIVCYFLS